MKRALRVVVASDAIGPLDSHAAGVAIAQGWAERAQVAVVPLADAGDPLAWALGALLGAEPSFHGDRWVLRAGDTLGFGLRQPPAGVWEPGLSSADLGEWVAATLGYLDELPRRIILDLTGLHSLDGGAGFLTALGARVGGEPVPGIAGLSQVHSLDLGPVQARLQGVELFGVVAADELGLGLLGLQGMVARRGYEVRLDPADLLAAESAMTHWLGRLGIPDARGVGAAGGVAAAVTALGGRVLRGAALCAELAGLPDTIAAADVVVTGCTSFDIGNRGGALVGYVADHALEAERPCLVFAVESDLSRREMRTFGVEAAYATGHGPLPEALTDTVVRVARGWTTGP